MVISVRASRRSTDRLSIVEAERCGVVVFKDMGHSDPTFGADGVADARVEFVGIRIGAVDPRGGNEIGGRDSRRNGQGDDPNQWSGIVDRQFTGVREVVEGAIRDRILKELVDSGGRFRKTRHSDGIGIRS